MELPEFETAFDSFSAARQSAPDEETSWGALEKLTARALACIQGAPSRSHHTSSLRAEAWSQLGRISEVVRDPGHLALAIKVAENKRAPAYERQGAIEFLQEFWNGKVPGEATADLLDELENDPPTRSFLVTVMQTKIDLGLDDEFGALCAVDSWDDENS